MIDKRQLEELSDAIWDERYLISHLRSELFEARKRLILLATKRLRIVLWKAMRELARRLSIVGFLQLKLRDLLRLRL